MMKDFILRNTKFYYKTTKECSSPQDYMLERRRPDEIRLSVEMNKNRSYGSMKEGVLEDLYLENHNLYEICGDNRRFYFDIEYNNEDEGDAELQFAYILDFLMKLVSST